MNTQELLKKLGQPQVAEALDLNPSAVRMWSVRNAIPAKWAHRIRELAKAKDTTVPDSVFSYKPKKGKAA